MVGNKDRRKGMKREKEGRMKHIKERTIGKKEGGKQESEESMEKRK